MLNSLAVWKKFCKQFATRNVIMDQCLVRHINVTLRPIISMPHGFDLWVAANEFFFITGRFLGSRSHCCRNRFSIQFNGSHLLRVGLQNVLYHSVKTTWLLTYSFRLVKVEIWDTTSTQVSRLRLRSSVKQSCKVLNSRPFYGQKLT